MARVPRVSEPFCQKCGIPTSASNLCDTCSSNPPAYRMMRSWAVFDSPIQDGLHTMKYRRNIGLGESIAIQMVDFVRSQNWRLNLMMPVPLGKNRLKERGYNQVGLVARPLAYRLGLQYAPEAVWKKRETRSQVG